MSEALDPKWAGVRDAIAELEGLGPEWPTHGNAPLAVTAGYAVWRLRARGAEARALEAEKERDERQTERDRAVNDVLDERQRRKDAEDRAFTAEAEVKRLRGVLGSYPR